MDKHRNCPVCGKKVEVYYTLGEAIMDLDGVIPWDESSPILLRRHNIWLQCSGDEEHDVSNMDYFLTEDIKDRVMLECKAALEDLEQYLEEEGDNAFEDIKPRKDRW